MEMFDAFDEVFASVERYVAEHGHAPSEVVVSPPLYMWLAELQREGEMLAGTVPVDAVALETPFGRIPLAIDETLSPFDVLAQ